MLNKKEIQKKYQTEIIKIWSKYHIQPDKLIDYIYLKQNNPRKAHELLLITIDQHYQYDITYNQSNYKDQYKLKRGLYKTINGVLK